MGCDQSIPLQTADINSAANKQNLSKSTHICKKSSIHGEPNGMSRSGQSTATAASTNPSLAPAVSLEVDEEISYEIPKVDYNGNLLAEEVVRRTSTSLQTTTVTIGNTEKGGQELQVQYAYRSQRGYNPDDPLKANQDKYGITLNLAGEQGDALFGVYDGHGEHGHYCASFAKNKLPQNIAKYVRQKRVQKYTAILEAQGGKKKGAWNPRLWPLLSKEEYEQCCKRAFVDTNKALREEEAINDKLSGTTAAAVCFHGGRMTVGHVGDSRVILGHRVPGTHSNEEGKEEEKVPEEEEYERAENDSGIEKYGELVAIPLTRDQTCYRRDERDRILSMGGKIQTIDQLEGLAVEHNNWGDFVHGEQVDTHGDPPRVWVPGKKYPGCAFTRSFGDSTGEDVGVTADPELVTCDLTARDEILVIASDGIFEFLTNQEVIDICAACLNPLQASEAVTKAAYDKWIEHDNRSDDITVIVCFLSSNFIPTADLVSTTSQGLLETLHLVYGSSPSPVFDASRIHQLGSNHYNRKASEIFAKRTSVSESF